MPGAPPDRCAGHALGIKLPRLASVLPLFVATCPGEVRLIATARPRRDSVESLKVMFDLWHTRAERAVACYARARDAALAAWEGPVLEVDYDATLADPAGAVARIADFAGLPATAAARAFVDPGLRRHGGPPV